jgi:NhaA family Na+:H+ antiporter
MRSSRLAALAHQRRRLTALFTEFFESEKSSGIVLMLCTLAALLLANSPAAEAFAKTWHIQVGFEAGPLHLAYDLEHWINDGLMAVFFLLIGLEIERELYIGELSDLRSASLPIFAAIGGMLTPALIYLLIAAQADAKGFGIPMATDIAFALGVLGLLGKGIPPALKIFLTALAIIDDLGAILVITLFYSSGVSLLYLALAAGVFLLLLLGNRLKVRKLAFYLGLGLVMWFLVLQSGVHAAVSGVLLAFAIPFQRGKRSSLSQRLQHFLHKPVAFFIMPLFALANTGIALTGSSAERLITPNTLGIFFGLLAGKPLGIIGFSLLAIKLGLSKMPSGMSRGHILGAGFLGGIGFTMAIFITVLAFGDTAVSQASKLAVLLGSLVAGAAGHIILRTVRREPEEEPAVPEGEDFSAQ